MYRNHNRLLDARVFLVLVLLLSALTHPAHASDCATYTAPLSVPVTTEDQYAASVAAGNQKRLAFRFEVAAAPFRYDDVVEFLERVEATLLPHFPQGVPAYNYEYFVFDRSVEKNYASAAEGGPIRVSEEFILDSESVDVVAFGIAHEMGHPVSQHTTRYLQDLEGVANDYWARLHRDAQITDPALREARARERLAVLERGTVKSETLMQPHEIEADVFAAHVATRAGYNPEIMARLFDRLAEGRKGDSPLSHPVDSERAALFRCFQALSSGPSREDLNEQLRTLQQRLREQRLAIDASAQNK